MSLKGQYRFLTLGHEQRLLTGEEPELKPGEAKFHSYYIPSLTAGPHAISVSQTVTPPKEDPRHGEEAPVTFTTPTAQRFDVLGPQWNLSAQAGGNSSDDATDPVLSVYPAPGHTAQFRTLPHIVLRDPHLPWARRVSKAKLDDEGKNVVPWFALLVFTADELQLGDDEADFFPPERRAKLNENLGWDLDAGSVGMVQAGTLTNFIPKAADRDTKVKTSVIAAPGTLFKVLFTNGKTDESRCSVTKYRYLAHVRKIATEGTMSASEGPSSIFSIVVSHRIGPVNVDEPTPVLVHLVSLQGIEGQELANVKNRVLLTSLFSWSYTALPPGSADARSTLRHLGTTPSKETGHQGGLSVLRTDLTENPKLNPEQEAGKGDVDIDELVTRRQRDGFTLVRHRTATGEETAALLRSPLVPTRVRHPLHQDVPMQSNFGSDFQIIDPGLGLMDISYVSAWHLGKTLALGDPAFTAALARLRAVIHKKALEKSRKKILKNIGSSSAYASRDRVVSETGTAVSDLLELTRALHATGTTAVSANRWNRRQSVKEVNFALRSDHVFGQMYENSLDVSWSIAQAVDGGPYNFHQVPSNTDYAAVQEWVLDKLHLASIPAHYLLPDPSHIPQETLRFFHIDENWTDALVDGALSLANHFADDPKEDYCRSALKATLNKYLATPVKDLNYCQQMPVYGFLLRSQILVQFPDLAVSAEFNEPPKIQENWANAKPKAPILVQRRLASDLMLVLFDREPPELKRVKFTLPAHQMTFVVAAKLNKAKIVIEHNLIQANSQPPTIPPDTSMPESERWPKVEVRGGGEPPRTELRSYPMESLFDWDSRTINVNEYANVIHEYLIDTQGKSKYKEEAPTSAILALQLNEPIYALVIDVQPAIESISAGWQMVVSSEQSSSSFRFHIPQFPANKYAPKTPLPAPVEISRLRPTKLQQNRQVGHPTIRRQARIPQDLDSSPRPTDTYPLFTLQVEAVNRGFVPTDRPTPTDLLFKIVLNKDSQHIFSYRLKRLEIRVPLGELEDVRKPPLDPKDGNARRPLIRRKNADQGPGPSMLSNLRFNVLRRWSGKPDATEMFLEVVPRTSYGVNMYFLTEASFMLPMVDVIPWDVPDGVWYRAWVQMTWEYQKGKVDWDSDKNKPILPEYQMDEFKVFMAPDGRES